MGEKRDSSVLFSLKELMSLEEQRIHEEAAARERARAAETEARIVAARRLREEEEGRLRAEEERRRIEESRRREEEAKLAAIRAGEIEKVRIAAEGRAHIEALALQREHERALELIQGKKKTGAGRAAAIGVTLAATVFAAGFGIYYGQIKPQADADALVQQAALRERDERNAKLQKDQDELQKKIADAEHQIFEEKKKKAIAMAAAQPATTPSARPGPLSPSARPKSTCRPCADRSSPLCDINGCDLN